MISIHHDCCGGSTTTAGILRLGVIAVSFRHRVMTIVP